MTTTTRAPIDDAALVLLRAVFADLEAGRIIVTSVDADDDATKLGLRLRWKVNAGAVDAARPALAGDSCPSCAVAKLQRLSEGLLCPACGARPPG